MSPICSVLGRKKKIRKFKKVGNLNGSKQRKCFYTRKHTESGYFQNALMSYM